VFIKPRARWLAATGFAAACLMAGSLFAAVPPAAASAGSFQAGPFPIGNMMSYANSEFMDGAANFVPVPGTTNASISNSTAASVTHGSSLLDTVSQNGTSSFELQEGTGPTQINLTGGTSYTVGAYFNASTTSGQSVTFSLDPYNSGGPMDPASTSALPLNTSGGWQYVQGTIDASGATYVLDSPEISISGVSAGEKVYMDWLVFEPTRAATVIGAHGDFCETNCDDLYSAADWEDSDVGGGADSQYIGPLQSDKEFFQGDLPASFKDTNCYTIEQWVDGNGGNQRQWPVCELTWNAAESTSDLETFLQSVQTYSPGQELYLVWFNEPELPVNDKDFTYCDETDGPSFVCEFNAEEGYIQSWAAQNDAPNIFTAMDAATYEYGNSGDGTGDNGTKCTYINGITTADIYLADDYQPTVDGLNLASNAARKANWNNWLTCVLPQNRPIGLGEYGLDQSSTSGGNGTTCTSDEACTPVTMMADQTYLEGLPSTIGEPVVLWQYWWSNCAAPATTCSADWQFVSDDAVSTWKGIETQNGGG
jgi:hypothetical protein